ncbi:MAG: hypothetical protein Q7S76_00960 [bacterium]|nr:hypothetical protein [bacterium]
MRSMHVHVEYDNYVPKIHNHPVPHHPFDNAQTDMAPLQYMVGKNHRQTLDQSVGRIMLVLIGSALGLAVLWASYQAFFERTNTSVQAGFRRCYRRPPCLDYADPTKRCGYFAFMPNLCPKKNYPTPTPSNGRVPTPSIRPSKYHIVPIPNCAKEIACIDGEPTYENGRCVCPIRDQ